MPDEYLGEARHAFRSHIEEACFGDSFLEIVGQVERAAAEAEDERLYALVASLLDGVDRLAARVDQVS